MLWLDSEPGERWFLTVTTRSPDTSLETFRRAMGAVVTRLRRRYGRCEYYGTIEGTSGRFAADGKRRMHGHFILKGLGGETAVAERLARETWERSTANAMGEEGRSWRVTLEPCGDGRAVAAYVAGYLSKSSQVMDSDWGGRRVRSSRGFFGGEPIELVRARAVGSLLGEAEAYREGFTKETPEWGLYAELGAVNREGLVAARRRGRIEAQAAKVALRAYQDVSVVVDEPESLQLSLTIG